MAKIIEPKKPTLVHSTPIIGGEVKPKTETRKEALNRLFRENGLVEEDVYKDKTRKFVIMTRTGIDKIVAKRGIVISYEPVLIQVGQKDMKNHVIVRASAQMQNKMVQSFGEASDDNLSAFNKGYPTCMAEKRAKSRCVLMLTGFYEQGVYGSEEEEDEWR